MRETFRFSTMEDAEKLAPVLREEDVQEVLAAGSTSPLASLRRGVRFSKPAITVDDENGNPALMMGVAPSVDPEVGHIWLLSSDIITRRPTTFLRQSRPWLEFFHSRYPVLTNRVDARNVVHIKWLRWLGFTFLKQYPGSGPGNYPFHEFVRLQHV